MVLALKGSLLLTGLPLLVVLTALLALAPREIAAQQPPQPEIVTLPVGGMT